MFAETESVFQNCRTQFTISFNYRIHCFKLLYDSEFFSFDTTLVLRFSELLKDRDRGRNRQLMAFNPRVLDVNSGEYLCPLCKRLSNTILPILPPLTQVFTDR